MLLPVIRWGKPYASLETESLADFRTGAPVAQVALAHGGLVRRDMLQARRAREILRGLSADELLACCRRAAELLLHAELPLGEERQSAEAFIRVQSATTGLPENLCRANLEKSAFVLAHMGEILEALTRGIDLGIFSRGYGDEGRGVTVSYQAQSPVLAAVLPSNSPGVHALWLPTIPLQIGLALKPGSREPWTPYRLFAALTAAGVPAEAFSLYPGQGADVGAALLAVGQRCMVFGDARTVEQYRGNPRVQAHGPGFSKILLGDDCVDRWEEYLDLMVESILANSGRSCINGSGVWASRHTREIAEALAARLGPIDVRPPDDPQAQLAAFTNPQMAEGTWELIRGELRESGVTDCTARFGPRLVRHEHCAYLRPMVVHCDGPQRAIANREYLFPFASVVTCPQEAMAAAIGPTLVCTAVTEDPRWIAELTDATNIDRLNVGPIPTVRINWRQPHEGNLVEFLFRARAYQMAS